MAKISIKLDHTLLNGETITFTAPCDCTVVDGITVTYPTENLDGSLTERTAEFVFRDAHKNNISGIGNLFAAGATVKAVLNTDEGAAYLQNADTNAYLEERLSNTVSSLNGQRGDIIMTPQSIGAAATEEREIDTIGETWEENDLGEWVWSEYSTGTSKAFISGNHFLIYLGTISLFGAVGNHRITFNGLPNGSTIIGVVDQKYYIKKAHSGVSVSLNISEINNGELTVADCWFFGIISGESSGSGGSGGDLDWVQALIDTAQRAAETANEAKETADRLAAQEALALEQSGQALSKAGNALSAAGVAAAAAQEAVNIANKAKEYGKENAGKLIYVGDDGIATVLAIGEGLKIVNGVLMIDGTVQTNTSILGRAKLGAMVLNKGGM